jgi:tetratricopeptide (TPR) repeat protein
MWAVTRVLLAALLWGVGWGASTQAQALPCRSDEQALAHHIHQAGIARGAEDLGLALEHMACAAALAPDDLFVLRTRGIVHLGLGNTQAALDDFNVVLARNPDDAIALNNRGSAVLRYEWLEDAIKDFSRALALDPAFARAYNNRGLAYMRLGSYTQALADFERAIALGHEPRHWPYNNIAILYRDLGDLSSAILRAQDSLRSAPDVPDTVILLAELYDQRGDRHSADEMYREYYRLTGIIDDNRLLPLPETLRAQTAVQYAPLALAVSIAAGAAVSWGLDWWRRRQSVA